MITRFIQGDTVGLNYSVDVEKKTGHNNNDNSGHS